MTDLQVENERLKAKLAYAEQILAAVAVCPYCQSCKHQAEEWFEDESPYRMLAATVGAVNGRWRVALEAVNKLLKRGVRVIDEALGHGQ